MKRFLKRRFVALRVLAAALILSSYVGAQESVDENAPPPPTEAITPVEVEAIAEPPLVDAEPAEEMPAVKTEADVAAEAGEPVPFDAADVQSSGKPLAAEDETTETVQERYPNGTIKIERGMKRDASGNYVLHGDWRLFDQKGTLLAEGRYKNNLREGQWRRFLRADESPLFATAPYNEFKDPFLSQADFVAGKLHGVWMIVDSKQHRVSEIEYTHGQRDGKAVWYHANGRPAHEMTFVDGSIDGEVRKWDAAGQVVAKETYEQGRRLGAVVEHYPGGQKKSQVGCLFAQLIIKTPDNFWTATLAEFETVGKDERHGHFVAWHENGIKQRSGEYEHDLPVGKMTWWYPNGQKSVEGSYDAGGAAGEWNWWYRNGQKSIAGGYADGRPAGDWNWWKEDGRLAQSADLSQAREVIAKAPAKANAKDDSPAIPAPTQSLRR